jgi:hypothetical protein
MSVSSRTSEVIKNYALEKYLLELEVNGLTVVPPEVHGFPLEAIDQIVELLLDYAEAMTGSPFSLDQGPERPLYFAEEPSGLTKGAREPGQFLIQQLAHKHRLFRDLAINPVAVGLMGCLIGHKEVRFSSHNSFIKWQGDFGYGPSLGMHADQTAQPLPWGRTALTSNTNWCLTEYSSGGGCLAYVPGSHRYGTPAQFPRAVKQAVPVEAAKGSMIAFHGATWHGAFPKKTPGLRLSIANYYRHQSVTSQEDLSGSFPSDLAEDCHDAALFKTLCGFNDIFPYKQQSEKVPRISS